MTKASKYNIILKMKTAILLSLSLVVGLGHAAESKPVKLKLPLLNCSEFAATPGKQGKCIYKTKDADWEIDYYLEGEEKTTLKGVVKNLIVLFHPSFNHANVREWWPAFLGENHAIDPKKYRILSIGMIGDGQPKVGSPAKLTASAIIEAQMAVLNSLFPKSDFIVGGASRGAHNAILFAKAYAGRTRKLFTLSGHGSTSPLDIKNAEILTNHVLMSELQGGTYSDLSEKDREQFWKSIFKNYLSLYYGPTFFENSEMMSELGLLPNQYKDKNTFFEMMLKSWYEWPAKTGDAVWLERQNKVFVEAMSEFATSQAYKDLPKQQLVISFKEDQLFLSREYEAYVQNLKAAGKNIHHVSLSDTRGHMACCTFHPKNETLQAIRNFLE